MAKVKHSALRLSRIAVIPAKAGIHLANLQKCARGGLDSRFRGNDVHPKDNPLPNDTFADVAGCGFAI
jgi:hypothetical protein